MITTLCTSCNRPAPEYDEYQELVQQILVQMASGITIIRIINQNLDNRGLVPELASDWVSVSTDFLHDGNDLRDKIAATSEDSAHGSCAEWKQTYRRMTALLTDLDFMRRDLIGHFVPKS